MVYSSRVAKLVFTAVISACDFCSGFDLADSSIITPVGDYRLQVSEMTQMVWQEVASYQSRCQAGRLLPVSTVCMWRSKTDDRVRECCSRRLPWQQDYSPVSHLTMHCQQGPLTRSHHIASQDEVLVGLILACTCQVVSGTCLHLSSGKCAGQVQVPA